MEEWGNVIRCGREKRQPAQDICLQLSLGTRRLLGTSVTFDIAVEQLIRIVLRRIGRQKK